MYRKLGSYDFEVSILSLGVRHLPLTNEDESTKMIDYAVNHGVNYIDLGYPYDLRIHERLINLVGKAVQGIKDQCKIAVTLPCTFINSLGDLDYYLKIQLRWLKADKAEFCVLGGLNRETWPKMERLGLQRWMEKAINDGQFCGAGFSFHDDFRFLRDIIAAYDGWSFCQFQYSYMDVDHHPGVSGLKYVAEKKLGVVVNEPLKGIRLAKEPPEPVLKIWKSIQQNRPLAEWGLLWVWNHPEVSTVVVDIADMKQLMDYIALAESAKADSLTMQELLIFNQVREAYLKLRPINCTGCGCCMPCPVGVNVPRIFELYNEAIIYGDVETARFYYTHEGHNAKNCIECSNCEDKCPRKIAIVDWLKKASKLLTT